MSSSYNKTNRIKSRLEASPATIEELSNYMECNSRTIYRYINEFKKENLGLKEIVKAGQPKRFFIEKHQVNPNLNLIRSLENMKDELIVESNHRYSKLLAKSIKALKGNPTEEGVSPEPISVDPHFVIDHGPFSEFKASEKSIEKFLKAIKLGQMLKVQYCQGSNEEIQTMEIQPLKLILRMGTLYLAYISIENKTPKILVFKRIQKVSYLKKFAPSVEINSKKFYEHTFGKWVSDPSIKPIKIVFEIKSTWLKTILKESQFNPKVVINTQNKKTIATLHIKESPDLKNWLISVLGDIDIIKPIELKEELKKELSARLKSLN
ncbi:MAG: WYL domain-containing protein [Fibrobacter sp.]|jgi:predicted DNA-binding transcriptional regulator YafY|nr:WYL domain-containing protein [Fibrobacter sp.]